MTNKKWVALISGVALAGLGVLLTPDVASAFNECGDIYCVGYTIDGGWWVPQHDCDPGHSCRCPYPASQIYLTWNECNGQAP